MSNLSDVIAKYDAKIRAEQLELQRIRDEKEFFKHKARKTVDFIKNVFSVVNLQINSENKLRLVKVSYDNVHIHYEVCLGVSTIANVYITLEKGGFNNIDGCPFNTNEEFEELLALKLKEKFK
jgi:hypothetical protein